MSDKFFYLQFKFIPKIGHTFTDEREVVVEVPKDLVQRKSESINEGLREVVALDLKGIRYYRRNHRENGARDRRSRPKSRVNHKPRCGQRKRPLTQIRRSPGSSPLALKWSLISGSPTLQGKIIGITGIIELYQGKPEIKVTSADQFKGLDAQPVQ